MGRRDATPKPKPDKDLSLFIPDLPAGMKESIKQMIPEMRDTEELAPDDGNDSLNDQVNIVSNSRQDEAGEPIKPGEVRDEALPAKPRTGSRQRKASFEEYRKLFLETPRIEDRKTVFISGTLRDKLDEVARKLGDRKMSVSGFIENLIRHHLDVYEEDLNAWKKL